ncbi:MAG: glycosyltransferase family 2 protein [Prevotella sp.]|nr:glycosyltransferase family 2 protein [Prevotella sp.]
MISIVINTYNAERHLAKVLDSVKDFDEVVICDMESTDSTLDIAHRYGCKVVTFPKEGHTIVEPARNFAIQSASYPWVLVVDADEIVPKALREYLYRQVSLPCPPDGIFIPRRNYFMGTFMHSLYPDYILRFFRKDKTVWPPIIHVQPEVAGNVIHAPKHKGLAFEHLADDSLSDRLRKTDTYTDYECKKKAGKRYGALAFLLRPTHRFIKSYILKGGLRDGFPGFIYACLEATYQVVMMGKMRERQ